jgi:phytol kinase
MMNQWLALVFTLGLALLWLRINDFAAQRGWIEARLSRKMIHAGTGPIFVLCWLLFPDTPLARYLAALIPLAITMQFALVGFGIMKDPAAVAAMSRSGDRREILRGPLFYGIVFVILTIVYWKNSPIGITALMLLCGGDGLADVIGSRLKSIGLPWSQRKSVWGSLAMLAGGWLFSMGVLMVFVSVGIFERSFGSLLLPVSLIAVAGTLVESLPYRDIDNLTVPLVAVLLGHLLF